MSPPGVPQRLRPQPMATQGAKCLLAMKPPGRLRSHGATRRIEPLPVLTSAEQRAGICRKSVPVSTKDVPGRPHRRNPPPLSRTTPPGACMSPIFPLIRHCHAVSSSVSICSLTQSVLPTSTPLALFLHLSLSLSLSHFPSLCSRLPFPLCAKVAPPPALGSERRATAPTPTPWEAAAPCLRASSSTPS